MTSQQTMEDRFNKKFTTEQKGKYWRIDFGNPGEMKEFIRSEIELAKKEEKERIKEWVKGNYSRNTSPIWAHVDLGDLLKMVDNNLLNNK